MNLFKEVWALAEGFLKAQADKYRECYLARMDDLPESERKTGHRGVFLP